MCVLLGTKQPPALSSGDGNNINNANKEDTTNNDNGEVRRRSSSAHLSDSENHPVAMQIVGSICEDGLGLMSWRKSA